MEESSLQTTIAGTAELSFHLFQQCLQLSPAIPPQELSLVEDQFARFSTWAANIGVFAPGRASMDHRLREAPYVQGAVTGLLETVNNRVQDCASCLESLAKPPPGGPPDEQRNAKENLRGTTRLIDRNIGLLNRLSNTIRRAGRESQNFRAAAAFKIQDDEGNDSGPLLKEVFANHIRDKFPEASESIRLRLAATMLTRRKRILYRRSRFGGNSIKVNRTNPQPQMEAPPLQERGPNNIHGQLPNQRKPSNVVEGIVPSPSQAAISATTLGADNFIKVSAPSMISTTKTVPLSQHEELIFPPRPLGRIRKRYQKMKKCRLASHIYLPKDYSSLSYSVKQPGAESLGMMAKEQYPDRLNYAPPTGEMIQRDFESDWDECIKVVGEITCPFCFFALPALDVTHKDKWINHVKSDLDAYICLFNECPMAEELYSHSDQWLKHMSKHALRWRCDSKSHGKLVFNTRDQYVDHMKEAHKGRFTDAQLEILAAKNGQTIGPLFDSCPLCGVKEVKNAKLEDHIIGHLRSLALRSLPLYDDEGSESSEAEVASSGTYTPRERSTINMINEKLMTASCFKGMGELSNLGLYDKQDLVRDSDAHETEALNDPELFVDMTPFEGIPPTEGRHFEWGLVTVDAEPSWDPETDPIIQNIALGRVQRYTSDESDSSMSFASEREEASEFIQTLDVADRIANPEASSADLLAAMEQGDLTSALLLLDYPASKMDSKQKGKALYSAAKHGWAQVVLALLQLINNPDFRDRRGRTPLSYAAQKGYIDVVRELVDGGSFPNSEDTLHRTPLSYASEAGSHIVTELLLRDKRVSPDNRDNFGQTPLSWAARNGHEVVITQLLQTEKVDPDTKDAHGQTPLWWAARNGYEAVVTQLLQTKKVDPNTRDNFGQTPLSLAAQYGYEVVVTQLLQTEKVDPDIKDTFGQTPLSWAARNGHEAVVSQLLQTKKVDPDTKNTFGQTPLSLAEQNGYEAVVIQLQCPL